MLQWRAELGDERMMGDIAKPPEEQGIKMPRVDEIQRTARAQLVAQRTQIMASLPDGNL